MDKKTLRNSATALTALLDICNDYELKSSLKGHHLIVRFGSYVYDKEKDFLYDFAQELGDFLTTMPKNIKEKYFKLKK
jgi:hypothetical protein